jgi:hypothetical protein
MGWAGGEEERWAELLAACLGHREKEKKRGRRARERERPRGGFIK